MDMPKKDMAQPQAPDADATADNEAPVIPPVSPPVIPPVDQLAQTRRKLAAIASRLLGADNAHIAKVQWRELNEAPDWLALPDDELALLQRRVGALVHTSEIRRWMDRPRLAAAKDAVGDTWMRALCTGRPVMPLPIREIKPIHDIEASDIASHLSTTGGSFLCAGIPAEATRQAVAQVLGTPAPIAVNTELASSFIARALS